MTKQSPAVRSLIRLSESASANLTASGSCVFENSTSADEDSPARIVVTFITKPLSASSRSRSLRRHDAQGDCMKESSLNVL